MEAQLLKRIKRLEIAVVVLFILLFISVGATVYSAIQIKSVTSKIPSYQEIKSDIQALNKLYKISEDKIPKAYDYTKDKAAKAYDYTKDKADELIKYIKDKK